MNTVTKVFLSAYTAKEELHRIFGVGIYSGGGMYANARFVSGRVEGNALVLTSSYFSKHSLEKAIEIGIDNI